MITDETIFALWDSPIKEDVLIGVELALTHRDWEWFKTINVHKNPRFTRAENPSYTYNNLLVERVWTLDSIAKNGVEVYFGLARLFFNKTEQ